MDTCRIKCGRVNGLTGRGSHPFHVWRTYELLFVPVGGASAERVARNATTGAMNLRAVALCAWVASLAHLLILFNRFDVVSPGAAALVATGLLSAIPALWVASAVLLAPGDVRAAVSVLTGRTVSLPVAVPATPESVSMKFAHHLVEDGEWSDLDEATTMSGGAHGRRVSQTRGGDGSEKTFTPVARDRFSRATPAGSNQPSRMSFGSRDSKDVTASGASDSAGDEPLPLRERRADGALCVEDERQSERKTKNEKDADDSEDDSEDDGESWRDAVVGIKGMAQALHDANNHVSMVALNADLTVSLSTMMLNTLRLFEAAGPGPAARGARGPLTGASRPPGGGTHEKGGADAESEPVDVAHLENVRKIVTDTCALAEPLFDKETPLVLYNALPPDEMCFLARDTFACCLFALVYRAGTRVVRGSCRLTTERADEEKKPARNAPSEHRGGALAGSPLAVGSRAGVRVSMEYLAAATDGASYLREDGSSGSSGPTPTPTPSEWDPKRDDSFEKRNERVRDDGVRDDAKRLGTAEMQFWRRRLRRLGGSLSVRRESGPGVGIATERIAMWVPTAGSDTLCDVGRESESGGGSRVASLRSIVERGERAAETKAKSASETRTHPKSSSREKERRVSLDVVSLVPPGPTTTTSFATPSTSFATNASDGVKNDEKLTQRGVSSVSVSFEADQPNADDRFGSARPSSAAREEKDEKDARRRIPAATETSDFETREMRGESRVDRAPRDARPSAGSSFHDSLYDSYLSTGSADFSILYVEDERVQAYFFVNKCRRVFGDRCRVCHETDGVAALERLNRGEQFTVVVSDIFMTGMDGISFFHALFDANLNAGAAAQAHRAKAGVGAVPNAFRHPAPPRLNIVLTGADVDPSRGAEDAELALDLNDLQDTYGVLCYNKTSAVDVVVDVIKPHVAFVERALTSACGLGEGFGGSAETDERADWIPAPPVTRGTIPETDPGVRASPFDQTGTEPFDSGRLDVDSTMSADDANRLGESGAAANLVARSGASYGAARGRPFPDVSGLRDERTRNECVSGT